jgi:hypothetical protein
LLAPILHRDLISHLNSAKPDLNIAISRKNIAGEPSFRAKTE